MDKAASHPSFELTVVSHTGQDEKARLDHEIKLVPKFNDEHMPYITADGDKVELPARTVDHIISARYGSQADGGDEAGDGRDEGEVDGGTDGGGARE